MAAVIVVLLVVAVAIAVVGPATGLRTTSSSGREAGDRSRPAPSAPSTPPGSAPLRPDASREPAAAKAAARWFFAGYLAYSYGRGRASGIEVADPRLITALKRARPRVPPAAPGRKAKVTSLQLLTQGRGTVQATATVDDGSGTQYPLIAYLDDTSSGWVVTRLGDD